MNKQVISDFEIQVEYMPVTDEITLETKNSVLARVQADLARLPTYANDEIEMFINGIPTRRV